MPLRSVSTEQSCARFVTIASSGYLIGKNGFPNLTFSPDGDTIASRSRGGVYLWDTNTGEIKRKLTGHPYRVADIAFSPDGNTIVGGTFDWSFYLWDAKTGKLKHTFTGHAHWVTDVAFSPDGSTLASESDDRTVLLWEIAPVKQVLVAASQRPPMYWINTQTGTLHRLVGANIENLAPNFKNAINLVVDVANDKLYWTEKTSNRTGKVRSANLDGSDVRLVKELTSPPQGLAVDVANWKLYLTSASGQIQRRMCELPFTMHAGLLLGNWR